MNGKLTITISGPQGPGKTIIAEVIQDALLVYGIAVEADPNHGVITPPIYRLIPGQVDVGGPAFSARIVEKQQKEDINYIATSLEIIAGQIERWIEWDKEHRRSENLLTNDGTSIMSLPVPYWPSHGQFKAWIHRMTEAAKIIRGEPGQ